MHKRKRVVRLAAWLTVAALALCGCSEQSLTNTLNDLADASIQITPGETMSADSKWINTDIIGTIDENTQVRLQDDFAAAANRELILNADVSEIDAGDKISIGTIFNSEYVLEDRMEKLMKMSPEDTTGLDTEVMSQEQLLHLQYLVQDYYDLAADVTTRNTQGMEPIREHIQEIQNISSLQELTAYLTDIGGKNVAGVSLLPLAVTRARNEEDAREYTVYVMAEAPLSMGEYADGYKDIVIRQKEKTEDMVFYALEKLDFSKKEIREILQSCYAFEIKLSEHIPSYYTGESDRDEINVEEADQVCDLEQLETMAGNYPIAEFLTAAGYEQSNTFTVEEPDQVKNVGRLYTEKNLENMKDYLLVQLVLQNADVLDETLLQKSQESISKDRQVTLGDDRQDGQEDDRNDTQGKDDNQENTQNNDSQGKDSPDEGGDDVKVSDTIYSMYVMEDLRDVVDEIYVGHYCTAQMKRDLQSLTNMLIDGFRDVLEQTEWMEEETRQKALEKLDNIGLHVLYPDQMPDFSTLDFSDCSSLLEARGKLNAFRQQQMATYINKPMDQSVWDISYLPSATCNAFYVPEENTINICAGFIASESVYDVEESLEYNLARIGAVIGHEISHGFDTGGYKYDKDGLLVNWWTEKDQEQFEIRARKLEQYYDALDPIPQNEGTYNGKDVSGEAIADMAGVKAALMAAKKLDDFDYDKFFRSYANLWFVQQKYTTECMYLTQDVHPLMFLRTNVTLQQFREFYDTYQIQPGDGMYLDEKDRISVW